MSELTDFTSSPPSSSSEQSSTNNKDSQYALVKCPKISHVSRSGHGRLTYANRIWMAVNQSKASVSEKNRKNISYTKLKFACSFEHNAEGELTSYGVKNLKKFLQQLDSEQRSYPPTSSLLNDPFRGLDTSLIGGSPCAWRIISPEHSFAEMIQLYIMNSIETVPFNQYNTELDTVINIMSATEISNGICYTNRGNGEPWTYDNIFHILDLKYNEEYLSQFLLYNSSGMTNHPAKFKLPSLPGTNKHFTSKWGFSTGQVVSMVSGKNNEGLGLTETCLIEHPNFMFDKFISNGFQLGSFTNTFTVIDIMTNLVSQLSSLGVTSNIDKFDSATLVSQAKRSLGVVLDAADISAAYWQWFVYRRATPVEDSIKIHQSLSNIGDEYVPGWFRNNLDLIDLISERNDEYLSYYPKPEQVSGVILNPDGVTSYLSPQYTLAVSNRNGYSKEPSYPNRFSVQVGASITFLKFMFNVGIKMKDMDISTANKKLFPTKDMLSNTESNASLLQPDLNGDILQVSTLTDERTVGDELDKLADNLAMSRCWAGEARTSDAFEGLVLGEDIAIRCCTDLIASWYHDKHTTAHIKPHIVRLVGFEGKQRVISSTHKHE